MDTYDSRSNIYEGSISQPLAPKEEKPEDLKFLASRLESVSYLLKVLSDNRGTFFDKFLFEGVAQVRDLSDTSLKEFNLIFDDNSIIIQKSHSIINLDLKAHLQDFLALVAKELEEQKLELKEKIEKAVAEI